MNNITYLILCLFLPLIGTIIGSLLVLFMKNNINNKLEKFLLGFASGIMIAASIWSLLIPSINLSNDLGKLAFIPASIGFILGIAFLLLIDKIVPHFHALAAEAEGIPSMMKKTTKMILAVTIHNIPEGMAIGVLIIGAFERTDITFQAALTLAIGIAIQNFPEGAIISMPLHSEGISKKKSFFYGFLSGIVEPLAILLTIALTRTISIILPYCLSFAAGAMIYVVADELIPDATCKNHSHLGIIGLALGFVLMMALDVALG